MFSLLGAVTVQSAVLPLFIFLAELFVVTISTVRMIFVARGKKYLSPLLGSVEIIVWLFAISQIMHNLTNVWCYAAFAAGFTVGNYLGILIEQKVALGHLVVRIIVKQDADQLVDELRLAQYGVTSIDGEGATGPVRIVFTVIKRKDLQNVVSIIKRLAPRAFYSVDDLHSTSAGVFPGTRVRPHRQSSAVGELLRVAQ